jgi:hypothetical protein
MKKRLIRRMSEAGEQEANIEPAPTRPGGERRVLLEETRA